MPINYLHLQNRPLMKALHFPMSGILRQRKIEKMPCFPDSNIVIYIRIF